MLISTRCRRVITSVALVALIPIGAARGQDLGETLLEEIIVTATKRAGGIEAQDAAVAVSAYGSNQLDAMHIRDLKAIGYNAPSVQLEDIGTTRGTANFSIRGLGINSSIPSIDPTVGVFVDGMYYGLNGGVVFDVFDLESVEVLRGPQGLLFGRNVTGGAVVLNTTRPTDEFSFKGKLAYETGDNKYASVVLSGPLSDRMGWKLAGYHNDDGGWHTNLANGNDNFGKAKTTMVRGALQFDFGDFSNLIIRAEHGESEGDGPAAHNGGCVTVAVPGLCVRQYDFEAFDFAIDEEGFYDNEWNNLIAEINIDVGFGDGTITNILGYRDYESATSGDIDATPLFLFHSGSTTDQDQLSNELRYSGGWDRLDVTAGVYYFTQEFTYLENRQIPPVGFGPPGITGGGTQDQTTWGVFSQFDLRLSDTITFNLGGRYTKEEKDARIATIPLDLCTFPVSCAAYDFTDSRDWDNFTPKIGIQVMPNEDMQFYAFWTKGYRSGGFNMRHTAVAIPNEAFNEEEQTSVEVGIKADWADGRVRTNLAFYRNRIEDMQRELNLADPIVGVVQLIRNTADATIKGFDAEITVAATEDLVIRGSAGYVDGEYNDVRYDISSGLFDADGVIDEKDLNLEIPRLAPWSYGFDATYSTQLSWGSFTAQAGYYRRDAAYYTDNNLGQLREADMVDARLAVGLMEDRLTVSLFGKNLKDQVTYGGDTQLPFFPGSTFTPLNKGRIWGIELQYDME